MQRGKFIFLAALAGTLAFTVSAPRPARAADVGLPANWKGTDIGDPGMAGSSKVDGDVWTVQGSGADLWGSDNDHFHFVYTPVQGDGSITARMLSTTGGHLDDGWEKTGVMIRADLDQDSAMVHTEMTNRNSGIYWHWRDDKAGQPHDVQARSPREFPIFMRTQRVGNDFAGYISYDGQLWRNIGFNQDLPGWSDTANFGLCVMSHEDSVMDTVKFDKVAVNPGQTQVYGLAAAGGDKSVALKWLALKGAAGYNVFRGPANVPQDRLTPDQLTKLTAKAITDLTFTDNDAALAANSRYIYGVTAVDSSGKDGPVVVARAAVGGPSSTLTDFVSTNIGNNPEKIDDFGIDSTVADTGADLNPTTGVIRIRGGGHDIWDQADDFNFTHQSVTGNFQVQVDALTVPTFTDDWSKGGVMVREDTSQGSRHASLVLAGWMGLHFQYRTTKDSDSAPDGVDSPFTANEARDMLLKHPITLRLTRTGDVIKAEYSTDGTTFVEAPGSPVTLSGLAAKVEVGLPITSHHEGWISEMLLQNLKITPQ